MNQQQFTMIANIGIRHGATVLAGVLAARGFTTAGNEVVTLAAAGSLAAAAVAWSYISKTKFLARLVAAAPIDDLTALFETVRQFRSAGASPILVAHLAQVASALAVAEVAVPVSSMAAMPAEVPLVVQSDPPAPVPPGVIPVLAEAPVLMPVADPFAAVDAYPLSGTSL